MEEEEVVVAAAAAEGSGDRPAPSSSKKLVAPKRPALGKAGTNILVRANHFLVQFKLHESICQYDVEMTPKISNKGIIRALIRQLLAENRNDFGGKLPAFDGSKSMFTAGQLPFDNRQFSVSLPDERGPSDAPSSLDKKYSVTIRHVSTQNARNLTDFLAGRQVSIPQELLQALDVVLREHPTLHYTPVSRSFYKKELGCADLDGGIVAWNGFYQSLRPTMQGLALNVDLATTAFHQSIPVIEFLKKQFRQFDPRARLNDMLRMRVKKALGRLRVQVVHRQTPRKYRIFGLSPSPTRDLTFPLDGGQEMTVVDYFKVTYNYQIQFPDLPCLQVQAKKASYLPMEVCVICDGQRFGSKLNDRQTTNLLRLACINPRDREARIGSVMAREDGPGRGDYVSNFQVEVAKQLTQVRARLLPVPKLRYGDKGQDREIQPKLGAWNLLNACVVEGGTVAYWALMNFDPSVSFNLANDFIYGLSLRCRELGVSMAERTVMAPSMRKYDELDSPKLEKCLRDVHNQATRAIKGIDPAGHLQLLVCIMADKHPSYGDLKRICETQIGVVTQCCLAKHVKQGKSQYLANLALKVNAKVGGRNVTLAMELPAMCPLLSQPTIIFGADVTHPHPGDDSGPSIAAVVGNTDWPSAIRYLARVKAQGHREEIIADLKEMVQELWREFCNKTRSRPERVIMFRDGVSEGQFDTVLQREVVALKEALREVGGPDYKPAVTWVVVQKRHHTKLFPADNCRDAKNNILPGTVVDQTITHPREFDFYLCSHAGIQGTSRPTHYHVLWDENGFTSDHLQSLIYNLCYTYARCTRSVSVVPPAYYADLAAYRARLYLESLGGGSSDTTSIRGGRSGTTQGSSGGAGTSRPAVPTVRPLPQVQRIVQEVMYYC